MREAITSLLALVVGLTFLVWFYSGDASLSLLRNFQNLLAGEGLNSTKSANWRAVREIDPMTDEVVRRAVRRTLDFPVRTEMTASCKSGNFKIEFAFFDARDDSGWELQRPTDVDVLQQAMDAGFGRNSFDFVHYRRRVGEADAQRNRLIPRYRNAITDTEFKGLTFEPGESIVYEFTLEGGLKHFVRIHPDEPGIDEIAIDCGHLKSPVQEERSSADSATLPMTQEVALQRAVGILSSGPHGSTGDEGLPTIRRQHLVTDSYCGSEKRVWKFDVEDINSGATAPLVIDARTGEMICTGLSFLDQPGME